MLNIFNVLLLIKAHGLLNLLPDSEPTSQNSGVSKQEESFLIPHLYICEAVMISFRDSMQNDEPEKVPFKGNPGWLTLLSWA